MCHINFGCILFKISLKSLIEELIDNEWSTSKPAFTFQQIVIIKNKACKQEDSEIKPYKSKVRNEQNNLCEFKWFTNLILKS